MLSTQAAPAANRLLTMLSDEEHQRVLSGCEQVELFFGNILSAPGETIHHIYFPINSFISLVMPIDGNAGLEVALVGNEGMYGIPVMLGLDVSSLQAVVQGRGFAWKMETARFHNELKRCAALQQMLNLYIYVSMRQLAQTAACNRFHVIEQRLARWLLMTCDRATSTEFHITHEFLSQMLGVRRVGVTKAASSLQNKRLISYSRGAVKINDVPGLEAAACSCYKADKETYARILHA